MVVACWKLLCLFLTLNEKVYICSWSLSQRMLVSIVMLTCALQCTHEQYMNNETVCVRVHTLNMYVCKCLLRNTRNMMLWVRQSFIYQEILIVINFPCNAICVYMYTYVCTYAVNGYCKHCWHLFICYLSPYFHKMNAKLITVCINFPRLSVRVSHIPCPTARPSLLATPPSHSTYTSAGRHAPGVTPPSWGRGRTQRHSQGTSQRKWEDPSTSNDGKS